MDHQIPDSSSKMMFHRLCSDSSLPEMNQDQMLPRTNVKLLTYNFFLRPPPIKTNEDDYKEERLKDRKSTRLNSSHRL